MEMGTTLISLTLLLLLLLQTLTLSSSSSSSTPSNLLNFSFTSPSLTPQNKSFFFSLNSTASQGALQITPDTSNNLPFLVNKAGRVLLNTPFTLHHQDTVASFNSSFTINIFHLNNTTPGQGFAFLIAPELVDPPPQSYGQYLGLTNETTDGDAANHIVAIELDTVKQNFDPDDNHVGLDINSVRSNATASLSPFGITISPVNSARYNVWIDYDGGQKRVWVYMALVDQDKPRIPVLTAPLDLSRHVLQQSYFGFAASTGDSELQLNCVRAWNLSVEALPGRKMTASKWALAISLPLIAAIVVSGVIMWWYFVKKRKVGDGEDSASVLEGTLKSLPGTPREFEFKVLRKATNDFDERMKLGQGGFGVVYKGVIPGEGTEVAVKKFSRDNMKGQDDFLAELSIINRLRHKHLVRLLATGVGKAKKHITKGKSAKTSMDTQLMQQMVEEVKGFSASIKSVNMHWTEKLAKSVFAYKDKYPIEILEKFFDKLFESEHAARHFNCKSEFGQRALLDDFMKNHQVNSVHEVNLEDEV